MLNGEERGGLDLSFADINLEVLDPVRPVCKGAHDDAFSPAADDACWGAGLNFLAENVTRLHLVATICTCTPSFSLGCCCLGFSTI